MGRYRIHFILWGFIGLIIVAALNSCTKSGTPIGRILYKETKNKVYKELDADSLTTVFKTYLQQHQAKLKNPRYLTAFYHAQGYTPVLLSKFYADASLNELIASIERIGEHGLSARPYRVQLLKQALADLNNKEKVSGVKQAYQQVVMTELLFAEALTQYSFALQFGKINPRKSLPRYYIQVERPDSVAFNTVLSTTDLHAHLIRIQPHDTVYTSLQKMLQQHHEKDVLTIIANLERMRWKFKRDSSRLVYVNIPAYTLQTIEEGSLVGAMKVVVGKADGHETPILSSRIHSVQVNPIWNIPASIAKKEILVQAKADRYYLANHGMDVYYQGKRITDPDTIDWQRYDEQHLPYSFKQRPGDANSLGLIKFLFNNGSSVYLHDTPAKAVFGRTMRAASHGCVRVEKPLDLAHALFGEGEKYTTIKEEMGSEEPVARTISLSPQPQVILDYATCTKDEKGQLQFYPDVYGLDSMLYRLLQ